MGHSFLSSAAFIAYRTLVKFCDFVKSQGLPEICGCLLESERSLFPGWNVSLQGEIVNNGPLVW